MPLNTTSLRSAGCAFVLAASLGLGACASIGTGSTAGGTAWTGTVQSVQETQSSGGWQGLVGSIGGSVVGALLGSGIGAGVGQTIATVITSSMGAVGGQQLGSMLGAQQAYNVVVRGSDGVDRTVQVAGKPTFAPGASVQVGADGKITTR